MNETSVFLTGVGLTLGMCSLVVFYLRAPLRVLLVELCGTLERAGFWTAFSVVTLICVPLIFALQFHPEAGSDGGFVLALARQLKWALVGVVVTVVVLGMVLGAFIPRREPSRATVPDRRTV